MVRLFIRGSLVLLIITSAAIGASLLMGRALPAGDQFMYSMQREPHWQELTQSAPLPLAGLLTPLLNTTADADRGSTVGLVSVDRRLTARRHLPGEVLSTTWQPDGNTALMTAVSDTKMHFYWIQWEGTGTALVDLRVDTQDALSPDGKWAVMRNAEQYAFNEIVPFDELLSLSKTRPADQSGNITPTLTSIYWTPDSRTLFELPNDGNDDKTVSVYRLDDTSQSFSEQEYAFDNTYPYAISPDGSHMVYLGRAERILPSPEPLDYVDHYETRLLDLRTGEEQVIAERPSVLQLWSPTSRYLLMFPFESKQMTLPNLDIPDWRVMVHALSGQLLPQSLRVFMLPNPLNKPADSTNHPEKKIYLYDVMGGESQLMATREKFGEGYIVSWMPDTDIIHLHPRVDYYVAYGRPDEELKHLQYEGEDLIVSQGSLSSRSIAYSASNRGAMSQPFYYVDFENDVVTPLELDSHLMLNGSLGDFDQTSFLTFAADDRSFGTGSPTRALLYQVSTSGVKSVADMPVPNNAFSIYSRLEDQHFAMEVYDTMTASFRDNVRFQVWWFENTDVEPRFIEVVGVRLTKAAWRPITQLQK